MRNHRIAVPTNLSSRIRMVKVQLSVRLLLNVSHPLPHTRRVRLFLFPPTFCSRTNETGIHSAIARLEGEARRTNQLGSASNGIPFARDQMAEGRNAIASIAGIQFREPTGRFDWIKVNCSHTIPHIHCNLLFLISQ